MAKFEIPTLELPETASKPLYAGVGATDLAVEKVREVVADVSKRVTGFQKDASARVTDAQKAVKDFEAKDLQSKATDVFNTRRAQVEARVSELQAEARTFPTKVQTTVKSRYDENVSTVTSTYGDLAKRGEQLVTRIRKQESTQEAASAAKTTTAKAKSTNTQAKKTAKTVSKKAATQAKSTAKSTSTTVKKSPAKSSAKATGTAAKKTAAATSKAATEATKKVGD